MKYLKKINLTDTTSNINIKKVIEETYHKGNDYYQEVENNQANQNNQNKK